MIGGSYTWDDDTNQANVEKHGISFERASLILERGNPVQAEVYERDGETRTRSVGQVNGDTVAVIHTEENNRPKIISAHKGRDLQTEYRAAIAAEGEQPNQIFDAEFAAWRALDEAQKDRNQAAYQEQQQRNRQELEAAQYDSSKDIEQITKRQRVEAIAERAPRLARDQIERDELAQEHAKQRDIYQSKITPTLEPAPSAADTRDQREQDKLSEQHRKQLAAFAARSGNEQERKSLEEKQRLQQERLAKYQAERAALAWSRGQANVVSHER